MPRDPARIDGVLEAVREYWKKYPDLRLGQLLVNAAGKTDAYYLEDKELVKALKEEKEN